MISDESGLELVEETTRRGRDDEVEPDVDDLDDDVIDESDVDDDDDAVVEDETEEDEDDDDTEPVAKRTKKRAEEDEDEDDDLLSPDDVEADLDRILKDRMVTVDEDEDEDDVEPEDARRGRRPAPAQAGRRAAVPELLPPRAGVGTGVPGRRRRLPDLLLRRRWLRSRRAPATL